MIVNHNIICMHVSTRNNIYISQHTSSFLDADIIECAYVNAYDTDLITCMTSCAHFIYIGMLKESILVFPAQKDTGDYHGNFKASMYEKWFKERLRKNNDYAYARTFYMSMQLHTMSHIPVMIIYIVAKLTRPSLIVLDNASYHKRKQDGTPNSNTMKIEQLKQYCEEHHIPVSSSNGCPRIYREDYKQAVQAYIQANVPTELETAARTLGHDILYSPPYQSDLDPIELVWAECKFNVARQHDNCKCDIYMRHMICLVLCNYDYVHVATTMEQVTVRITTELNCISSEAIHKKIVHCNKIKDEYNKLDEQTLEHTEEWTATHSGDDEDDADYTEYNTASDVSDNSDNDDSNDDDSDSSEDSDSDDSNIHFHIDL